MEKILLVNPSAETTRFLESQFSNTQCTLQVHKRLDGALETFEKSRADLVILEIGRDTASGLAMLKAFKELLPQVPVLIITAVKSPEVTIEVMKIGAYDLLHVPCEEKQAKFIILDALNTVRNIKSLKSGLNPVADFEPESIIGSTPAMIAIFKIIGQVAPSNANVLITGESGTGKELIARAIYRHSLRKGGPYMAVNCAAIPEALLESELFGHEKGAFTGATQARVGKFEYCDEGTLFLDEIGDIPLAVQAKLLRVLQDGEFTRVGSNVPVRVNVRVIAATNRNLETDIQTGRFREDLYYRLNVVRIEVPSLRERRADIPELAISILRRISARENIEVFAISQEAMKILQNYSWPGNVRELENCLHRAAVLATGDTILPHHLPQAILGLTQHSSGGRSKLTQDVERALDTLLSYHRLNPERPLLDFVEREFLLRVLQEEKGNQVKASQRLGMARATLRKRIAQLGISQT
jgi:DNA-binding NtrC family response regulator